MAGWTCNSGKEAIIQNEAQVPFSCELVNRSKTNRINPKYVGCAMEEDYIGKIASVCKGATHPLTLGKRVLQRCLLGLNVYLMTLASEKPAS